MHTLRTEPARRPYSQLGLLFVFPCCSIQLASCVLSRTLLRYVCAVSNIPYLLCGTQGESTHSRLVRVCGVCVYIVYFVLVELEKAGSRPPTSWRPCLRSGIYSRTKENQWRVFHVGFSPLSFLNVSLLVGPTLTSLFKTGIPLAVPVLLTPLYVPVVLITLRDAL